MRSFYVSIFLAALIMIVTTVGYLTTYDLGYAGEKGPWFADTKVAKEGWSQFQRAGCAQCHSILGQQGQSLGPDLTYAGKRWNEQSLEILIKNPGSIYKNTIMPSYEGKLSDEQMKTLTQYLATLK